MHINAEGQAKLLKYLKLFKFYERLMNTLQVNLRGDLPLKAWSDLGTIHKFTSIQLKFRYGQF